MSSNISIIEGTITNELNHVLPNSVIKIDEINPDTNIIKTIGYVITDINGYYSFALVANENYIYELSIFPPLSL